MAGHSRWRRIRAKRLAEVGEEPEYEATGRDLVAGDQLSAIRISRGLTQAEVAERAAITVDDVAAIELGGGCHSVGHSSALSPCLPSTAGNGILSGHLSEVRSPDLPFLLAQESDYLRSALMFLKKLKELATPV